MRLVEKDGSAGSLEKYTNIIRVNQIGTFNTLRLAAVAMAKNEAIERLMDDFESDGLDCDCDSDYEL